ncbi:MAG: hypothetical protein GX811_01935 [Lentisphaerae bacterium]|nr:hypothetical protein [Lentisphaerota bacterium]
MNKILAPLKAEKGVFAALGNHDYWHGSEVILHELESLNIRHVGGKHESVTLDDGTKLLIAGFEYPWFKEKLNLPVTRDADFIFALTHTPDNVYNLEKNGADVVFAGHNHAGHVRIPFFGPLVTPSIFGRRFMHGMYNVGSSLLFVTSGVGSAMPGFRVYCQPDIFVIDFYGALSENGDSSSPFLKTNISLDIIN